MRENTTEPNLILLVSVGQNFFGHMTLPSHISPATETKQLKPLVLLTSVRHDLDNHVGKYFRGRALISSLAVGSNLLSAGSSLRCAAKLEKEAWRVKRHQEAEETQERLSREEMADFDEVRLLWGSTTSSRVVTPLTVFHNPIYCTRSRWIRENLDLLKSYSGSFLSYMKNCYYCCGRV